MRNIPYKIVGGQNFYGRREIKDLVCYLKVIENGQDDISVKRVVNVPKRGIGLATIDKLEVYANSMGINLLDAMFEVEVVPGLAKAHKKLAVFTDLIEDLRNSLEKKSISDMFDELLDKTGYSQSLISEGTDEAKTRLENISELKNKIVQYEEETEQPNLAELLEEIALVAEIDNLDESIDKVVLMTLHSAKGLEFPNVFIVGMEERLFPSAISMNSEDEDEIEEERRLCYVGITRAMEKLYLSAAKTRMTHGNTNANAISRFVKEISNDILDMDNKAIEATSRPVTKTKPEMPYAYASKPMFGKEFVVNKAEVLDYSVGDRVSHIKFGIGEVIEIVSGGKDYEVSVNFDNAGVKKMFASFAKLKKQ